MRLEPLGDRILVKRIDASEKSKGGLFIPDVGKEKPLEGIVSAVGEGRLTDDRVLIPTRVRVGDRILFGKYAGVEVKIDEVDYAIVREDEVLGILR